MTKMARWKPINIAPRDGTRILAHNIQTGMVDLVYFCSVSPPEWFGYDNTGWAKPGVRVSRNHSGDNPDGWKHVSNLYDFWTTVPKFEEKNADSLKFGKAYMEWQLKAWRQKMDVHAAFLGNPYEWTGIDTKHMENYHTPGAPESHYLKTRAAAFWKSQRGTDYAITK